ncbi:MAG: helix-turn-helix domain-containing protein, partial [Treponema sp.]|nr:helix-turn-helix domain-containing protein [Treponema sp.]
MKKRHPTIPALSQDKSSAILHNACELMSAYARTTGAFTCINDHNYMPIPELFEEITDERNTCLFCIRHQKKMEIKSSWDLCANPCKEMHINAIKESYRFGGSYTYVCSLGFLFWTSPIYIDGHFTGALTASGFLGIDSGETCARMRSMCDGSVSEAELKRLVSQFPRGDGRKIKALAELMLICAKSLSVRSEGCHASTRRRAEQQADLSAKIEDMKKQYPPGSPCPDYPLDKERELIDALHRADTESGRQIFSEILAAIFFSNPDQFKHIQYRAMELAVLISRADTGTGFSAEAVLEANNQYIKSIQGAGNFEELTDAMFQIFDDVAGQIFCFHGIHHASALKKAERFIFDNFTRRISLEEIAKTSGFSAPYFSTIFKEEMGENLSRYLNRLRVEKAGYMLTGTNFSLSKIACACGFEDQSWFSKIFKLYTGMNPGKYRSQGGKTVSRIP